MANKWIDVSLSDISERIGDGLHGTPTYSDNGEYYFVNGNNLENGEITIKDSTKKVGLEQYLKHKKDLNSNAILVSINGTIGNVALYNGEEVVLGKSACYINLKSNIHRDFVAYVLSSHQFQEYIQRCATGSTIKNVSLKMMREFSFRMPEDETEQIKAVETLKNLDGKISLNRKSNQTLEQMAQALFKSWFVDFDPVIDNALASGINISDFPEALQHRAEQRKHAQKLPDFKPLPDDIRNLFSSEFEQSEELSIGIDGWIPKGWKNGTFGDVSNGLSGFAFKSKDFTEEGCAVIKIKNISTDRSVDTSDVNRISTEVAAGAERFLLADGDILIAMTGAGSVGRFAMFSKEKDEPHYLNQRICKLSPKVEKGTPFLFAALNKPGVEKMIFKAAQGSGQPNISVTGILATQLLVPNTETIELFNSLLIDVFERKIELKRNSFSLSKLRDTLIPKLISGEISLSESKVSMG